MEDYVKRVKRIDDFSKLYAELKRLNRVIGSSSKEDREIQFKKQLVQQRVEELMFSIPVYK